MKGTQRDPFGIAHTILRVLGAVILTHGRTPDASATRFLSDDSGRLPNGCCFRGAGHRVGHEELAEEL